MGKHNWKHYVAGGFCQTALNGAADLEHLAELDRKQFAALSMPLDGVRFDRRTLELMDVDHDGRIRVDEVLGAIDFLKAHKVDLGSLFHPTDADRAALADVVARQADLAAAEPSAADRQAMADWEAQGKTTAVAPLGEATAAAVAALTAVEKTIDEFFTPPADLPLVTEAGDVELPLKDHLNPRYLEAILDFAAKCVTPVLGERAVLTRMEWKRIKATFAPYREWIGAKPVMGAAAKAALDDEERILRYRIHLLELLENYVNLKRLYDEHTLAIFQTGVLRIDAKELNLCLHVASEAAHSALAEKSGCCIVYLKLTRPAEGAERQICAVVTAGTVAGLYAGRNGVFNDRDGKDWEAVVTKVVEAQVSLVEAFWSPWKKLGESITGLVKKFLGDRQAVVDASMASGKLPPPAGANGAVGANGAAMASSVAAIGIGVGMLGAAFASILAAVKGMPPHQLLLAVVAMVLVVSLPSVILTWFRLRRRDLSAVLNASGWAINRELRFSMRRARAFTKCAPSLLAKYFAIGVCVTLWLVALYLVWSSRWCWNDFGRIW